MTSESISEKLKDRAGVLAALKAGIHEAVELHKMKNLPMVVSRDGKIVWISPDEFQLDTPTKPNGSIHNGE